MVCVYVMYTCLPELIFADSDFKKKQYASCCFIRLKKKKTKDIEQEKNAKSSKDVAFIKAY